MVVLVVLLALNSTTQIASDVNDVLSRYIVVHDDILALSLRKVIPIPGIFEKIDFCQHEQTLADLGSQLTARLDRIEPHPRHQQFLDRLQIYGMALSDAISQLQLISKHLCRKSGGAIDYTWDHFSKDMDRYNAAVDRYMTLGNELNTLLPTIRE